MLTDKDLYCVAMTVQAKKFTVYAAGEKTSEQACTLCKYKGECFKFGKDGSIKKYRHGLGEAMRNLQDVTGVYLGY